MQPKNTQIAGTVEILGMYGPYVAIVIKQPTKQELTLLMKLIQAETRSVRQNLSGLLTINNRISGSVRRLSTKDSLIDDLRYNYDMQVILEYLERLDEADNFTTTHI